jgi:hypothetical protein
VKDAGRFSNDYSINKVLLKNFFQSIDRYLMTIFYGSFSSFSSTRQLSSCLVTRASFNDAEIESQHLRRDTQASVNLIEWWLFVCLMMSRDYVFQIKFFNI